jgi:hypothetical protein
MKTTMNRFIAIALAAALTWNGCASSKQTPPAASAQIGASFSDLAKKYEVPLCSFSYVWNGKKYSIVSFGYAPSPVVFEDNRLYGVISEMQFRQVFSNAVWRDQFALENGLGSIHSWIEEHAPRHLHDLQQLKTSWLNSNAGAALLLAPVFLVCAPFAILEYQLEKNERARGQALNESVVTSDRSFSSFLSQLPPPKRQVKNGSYTINEYDATLKLPLGKEIEEYYHVGFLNDKPICVAYYSGEIRNKLDATAAK